MENDQPLSYWMTVARMGFEDDFNRLLEDLGISRTELAERFGATPAYISKILNGRAGNFQIETMAKLARAIDAVLQIRLIKGEGEVIRIVDYETARALDSLTESVHAEAQQHVAPDNLAYIEDYRQSRARPFSQEISTELLLEEDYG